jgi:hypothetical protein
MRGPQVTMRTGETPFSAKLPPPKPKNADRHAREYLTSAEVDQLMHAARRIGRHSHRDATLSSEAHATLDKADVASYDSYPRFKQEWQPRWPSSTSKDNLAAQYSRQRCPKGLRHGMQSNRNCSLGRSRQQ